MVGARRWENILDWGIAFGLIASGTAYAINFDPLVPMPLVVAVAFAYVALGVAYNAIMLLTARRLDESEPADRAIIATVRAASRRIGIEPPELLSIGSFGATLNAFAIEVPFIGAGIGLTERTVLLVRRGILPEAGLAGVAYHELAHLASGDGAVRIALRLGGALIRFSALFTFVRLAADPTAVAALPGDQVALFLVLSGPLMAAIGTGAVLRFQEYRADRAAVSFGAGETRSFLTTARELREPLGRYRSIPTRRTDAMTLLVDGERELDARVSRINMLIAETWQPDPDEEPAMTVLPDFERLDPSERRRALADAINRLAAEVDRGAARRVNRDVTRIVGGLRTILRRSHRRSVGHLTDLPIRDSLGGGRTKVELEHALSDLEAECYEAMALSRMLRRLERRHSLDDAPGHVVFARRVARILRYAFRFWSGALIERSSHPPLEERILALEEKPT